jgi:toxin ParE1/3/4
MPDRYFVRITPRALADLRGIFNYIRADSPQNAAEVIRRILDAIDGLDVFPHRYDVPRVNPPKGRKVRSMPVRPYLVRYRIDERKKAVYILRIRHGARRRP